MPKLYLTIDDGPSEKFTALVDYLKEHEIPAVFFNRGDMMDTRPEETIYGIHKGYTMANHTYSHRRASKLPAEKTCEEIAHTEKVLDRLYDTAGVPRTAKYFRFPYMDRGMGPCFAEPDSLDEKYFEAHFNLLGSGLGHVPEVPTSELIEKKRQIQAFLMEEGFERLPVPGVTLPWYTQTEMADAIDSLCTYSSSDWALLDRHRGQHGFHTIDDLKAQIDEDQSLQDKTSHNIVLVHDQAEIHEVTIALLDHFRARGFEFANFD
jgi:peptidoglycan/xylan/chitin deacetylase (PgdA/CDA1 family)